MSRAASAPSLRVRLTVIILVPLLAIAAAAGAWQLRNAVDTATGVFDRSLLTTALAVSGDVARLDGQAVSIETRDLLADTSGGRVFYHVYAPDGVFVIGYATPPPPPSGVAFDDPGPSFYTARYRGADVRVARLRSQATIAGMSGLYTITVWQEVSLRDAFVADLAWRSLIVIGALLSAVALVVWFGVTLGLRPLLDLEEAISRRSSDDLSPIRRAVPIEARGLVDRLNRLFAQVSSAMSAQTVFISNAAHQLRNPIAGVMAMAEAVRSAPTGEAAQARAAELLEAARRASDLANKLLTLERAAAAPAVEPFDLRAVAEEAAAQARASFADRAVALRVDAPETPAPIVADRLMVREALTNLIDNAYRHGGPGLSAIDVAIAAEPGAALVRIRDDGVGVPSDRIDDIVARFGQIGTGQGSGLGLSIADAVARRHGGALDVRPAEAGFDAVLRLPDAGARRQRPTA